MSDRQPCLPLEKFGEGHPHPRMDAILVVDKPAGITSHDVVARVRRILGERSIGHLGTLDPMATGVLPLLVGCYTRLAQFFAAAEKTYQGTIRFGFATDTYDSEGQQLGDSKSIQVSLEEIQKTAREMEGDIDQIPPKFSAKKIGGVPAYKLARKEQDVKMKPVPVRIERFEIHDLTEDLSTFTAQVSAGTYVRALANDLGQRLGTGAHLAQLRRTISGEFSLDQAISLERLAELPDSSTGNQTNLNDLLEERAIHPRKILSELPSITVNDEVAALIGNGRAINLPDFSGTRLVKVFLGRDQLICIASRVAGTLFQPKVVLKCE
jgi:tRNA pseudouridine55 synthase